MLRLPFNVTPTPPPAVHLPMHLVCASPGMCPCHAFLTPAYSRRLPSAHPFGKLQERPMSQLTSTGTPTAPRVIHPPSHPFGETPRRSRTPPTLHQHIHSAPSHVKARPFGAFPGRASSVPSPAPHAFPRLPTPSTVAPDDGSPSARSLATPPFYHRAHIHSRLYQRPPSCRRWARLVEAP